jgi:5-methylcytosine-specific restriction endonuclease McrA
MSTKYYEYRQNLKKQLFKRDGNLCRWCEKQLNFNDATLDHWIPKGLGGNDDVNNFVLSCEYCNMIRGKIGPKKFDSFINFIIRSPRAKRIYK